ncbi:MAG: YggS family pyridoxal phosphate-dependent enzyme [Prevotellaceae bacterium]|nr:YggS family pyridoxal phosphate-dependent enzyme [Prevotellaceae bacterium]MDY3855491.1 YggS family pyridoxal phosphate-dependent enzyme [Bacteroidaceae bacterium]
MGKIADNLRQIKESLPQGVTLVAVSKFHPVDEVMEAYDAGQRIFGENIVQELRTKHEQMPKDIEWHFIGHLQTNKVKYLTPFVSMIHSVDSLKLLSEIDKHAARDGRVIPCLLQVHVAQEETKFGFTPDELQEMLDEGSWRALLHVHIRGLMCMATNTDDTAQVAREFDRVKTLYDTVKARFFADQPDFDLRSWGMSGDYEIAVAHGSNMVRVGSKIFGPRPYPKTEN